MSDMGMEVRSANMHATFWSSLNQENKSTKQHLWTSDFVDGSVKLHVSMCELVRESDTKRNKPWS